MNGFWSKGIASPGPIDDNAGDALGSVVTDLGAARAGKAWLPVESGVDHLGGFLREEWLPAV
ncbi:hypothetical protein [Accumulibacter sp.]|uniref:hypothetical protein n=1 Tax=Accumulibacter sp. TaxID=2053492 RepID=UPI001A3ECC9B|nr:hypothetical protein [Accumulibacter sp.]MBL8375551.1 hypothetical protein [Accumulibacter sp.]